MKRLKFFKSVEIQSTFGFNRFASTGDYKALSNQPQGNGNEITDWEKFEKFVEVNGDKTQVEMAEHVPEKLAMPSLRDATRTAN